MPYYRVDFRHTNLGTRRLVASPSPYVRRQAAEEAIESVGGSLVGLWYALGQDDGFAIVEAPDNESVVAAVLKVNAAGGVVAWTTALMTPDEFASSLERAGGVTYEAPRGAPEPEPEQS